MSSELLNINPFEEEILMSGTDYPVSASLSFHTRERGEDVITDEEVSGYMSMTRFTEKQEHKRRHNLLFTIQVN